ncbi:MAG: YIP1 family protein [Planctomycetota bacterium]
MSRGPGGARGEAGCEEPVGGGSVDTLADQDHPQSELGPLGLRHIFWVYVKPLALFRRVEDSGKYGWALAILLGLNLLTGYMQVQTGLIDRVGAERTEQQLAELERTQFHLIDRMEMKERMEEIRKQGEFTNLMARLGAIVLSPLHMLVSILLISSLLYAAVALTGRKPEYHTLMSVCVYAGYFVLLAHVLRLAMMLAYRTVDVATNLGMFAPAQETTWLAAIDPFRIWFWVLVAMGLTVTQQLSRRVAIVSCSLMCLAAAGARVGWQYVALSG